MRSRTTALDATIFGVDVQSGDVRGSAPSYALVELRADGLEKAVVSYRKLRRRIDAVEPALIATDNVYELAADRDALVALLDSLPAGTRLVQVTGGPQPEPLSRVASRHDVAYAKEPMAEAEAAARLAAANVGQVVTAFTGTTRVKVARGRATGKGGWSEDRHTRRIHGAVKRRAREVEDELEAAGLEYDMTVHEKYGGYQNAVFAVAATPDELPVTAHRSGDVRVEVDRERTDGIEFQPLAKRRDHVIVGIDPGTTTGIAVVSRDGTVHDVHSSRTIDTAAVIEWIIARGRPFLVAADVTPMPDTVEKVRRSFDAAAWTPASDLLVDRKLHRTREIPTENDHERDAVAAALFACDAHADQFERIAGRVPPRLDTDAVIARVVADGDPVASVIEELTETPDGDEPDTDSDPTQPDPERSREYELEERVEELEAYIGTLTETIAERDERIEELESELSSARQEERREVRERREVTRLQREIDRLERERDDWEETAEERQAKLERLKRLWKLDHSNFSDVAGEERNLVPVKPVAKFTKAALDEAMADFGITAGDVVYLRDASGAGRGTAERLADLDPRLVLCSGGLSDVSREVLFQAGVPFGDREAVRLQEVDELAVTHESDVEDRIAAWRDRAAERRRERKASMVDQVISEHRADRNGPASSP